MKKQTGVTRSLPTPVGIRDLSPERARVLYRLETTLTQLFEKHDYDRVVTPVFELAHIFERGLDPEAAARLLRFVDPQNGELLVLRSDITPQIARLMGGVMRDTPLPARLCYFGRVFRLRQHSEFQRRELIQAGVELIGPSTAEGDVEIVALCAKALEATTSRPHRLSLGHAGVLATILRALDLDHSNVLRLRSVLHKKSPEQLNALQTELEIPAQIAGVLSELPHLYGDPDEVLVRAQTLESRLPSLSSPLDRLRAVVRGLTAAGLRERCLLDLGEVSGFGYYSGLVFRAYLPGIGQAVASGGRYDHLLARYGPDRPAAGFAIDEEGLTESEGPR